jgi:hypothetical protein
MAFWPCFLFIWVEGSILGLGSLLIWETNKDSLIHKISLVLSPFVSPMLALFLESKVNWFACGIAFLTGTIFSFLFTWMILPLFVARITDAQIKGFNFWGIPIVIRWEDVTSMKPVNMAGLRFLRISSSRHFFKLWVAMQISRHASTCQEIAALGEKPRQLLTYLEDS